MHRSNTEFREARKLLIKPGAKCQARWAESIVAQINQSLDRISGPGPPGLTPLIAPQPRLQSAFRDIPGAWRPKSRQARPLASNGSLCMLAQRHSDRSEGCGLEVQTRLRTGHTCELVTFWRPSVGPFLWEASDRLPDSTRASPRWPRSAAAPGRTGQRHGKCWEARNAAGKPPERSPTR